MLSDRVSAHRTGRPRRLAAAATTANSGYTMELGAEPAAHVGRDHADLLLVDLEQIGEVVPDVERHLRRTPDRVPAVALGHHGDRVRLHRHRRQALLHEPRPHDDVGARQHVQRPSAARTRAATFEPWAGNRSGAPSATAASASITASSGSTSAQTTSAASCLRRASRRSPRRPARRRSGPRRGRAPRARRTLHGAAALPPRCPTAAAAGSRRSSAVKTADDPRHRRAPRPALRCRVHARVRHDGTHEHGPERPRDRDVLDVPALAPEEPRVFRAEHRHAEDRGRQAHGPMLATDPTRRRREPDAPEPVARPPAHRPRARLHGDRLRRRSARAGRGGHRRAVASSAA